MALRFGRLLLVLFGLAYLGPSLSAQEPVGGLIPKPTALRYGLLRTWFTQIELDRARGRIVHVIRNGDTFFVQTDQAVVHAIDAETGRTLWTAQLGSPEHPSLAPAANRNYVAAVNGSRLYVVERETARPKWIVEIRGVPAVGAAMTESRVFVPLINGRIESYELEKTDLPPWNYSTTGRASATPFATAEKVYWTTDRGHLYLVESNPPGIVFRLETRGPIAAAVGYRAPLVFVASVDGYVYAVDENTGAQKWRFAAGSPITEPPVAIEDRVYVCADQGGMFCLSAESGEEIWWAPDVERFLAATRERVFGTNKLATMMILDGKSGARLGQIPIPGLSLQWINQYTDRIYLGTHTGLIQCLHDVAYPEPLRYMPLDTDDKKPPATGETAPEEAAGEDGETPQPDQPAAPATDDPFGAGGDNVEPFR